MEQHSQQFRKPLSQEQDYKESWKAYNYVQCRELTAIKFIEAFLAGYTSSHERYNINIYMQRITKLLIVSNDNIATHTILNLKQFIA